MKFSSAVLLLAAVSTQAVWRSQDPLAEASDVALFDTNEAAKYANAEDVALSVAKDLAFDAIPSPFGEEVEVEPSPVTEIAAVETPVEIPVETAVEETVVTEAAPALVENKPKHKLADGEVKKFVVMTTSRSGSTWLGSILQSHPQILFHLHECLADEFSLKTCVEDWNVDPMLLEGQYSLQGTPMTDLLDSFYQKPKDLPWKSHIGFKWMTQQLMKKNQTNEDAAVEWLVKNNVAVVALRRENKLRKCASIYDMQERKKSGQTVHKFVSDKSQWGETKIEVPLDHWKWCLGWYDMTDGILNRVTMNPSVDAIHVYYKNLCTDTENQLQRIKEFINVPMPITETKKSFVKIHSAKTMYDIVSNWEEIRTALLATVHADKITEFENLEEC